ncbi:MAG: alpha/beta hydrolase [Gammaproteobacteria bacterium]|nr:alpha/beta hydrolase [Gammaproteobacteria bacterium]
MRTVWPLSVFSRGRSLYGLRSLAALILVLGAFPGASGAARGGERDWPPPPGRLLDVAGHRMHIHCLGEGGPTVVFDSGLGGMSLEWREVQRLLAPRLRVCAYDRSGYGWSEPSAGDRLSSQLAGELQVLLEAAQLAPPYVLVGHSFGGYNVRYFAAAYPERTAGLVLVDASHPEQAERIPQVGVPQTGRRLVHRQEASILRMVRMFQSPYLREQLRHYPQEIRDQVWSLVTSGTAIAAQRLELRSFNRSAHEVSALSLPPGLPLAVVSRGRRVWAETPLGDARETVWDEMQRELAALSGDSRRWIAEQSGHMVHLEQPGKVAEAVVWVAGRACARLRQSLRQADCQRLL